MYDWIQLTCDEINALDRSLPVIIPVGLIEAHGPHLAVSVDFDTASYFARRVAEEAGCILAPTLPYGFADEMSEYTGTVGLSCDTCIAVFKDLACSFCQQGFDNIIFLSGHGANKIPFEVAIHRIWEYFPKARIAYWNYWTEAGVTGISHADKGETEIAMAVGSKAHMDRVVDFKVQKPWYRIRSRAEICPDSGGINGQPSKADKEEGIRVRDLIVSRLTEKCRAIRFQQGFS